MKQYVVMASTARNFSKLLKLNYNGTFYVEIATGETSELLMLARTLNDADG